jgi:uncharacterized protein YjbJ (UPF0337 family)
MVTPQIGNITGMRSLARSGANEHAAGRGELQAAKGMGYVQGTKERVGGKKDQMVGAATGDYSQENAGMHHLPHTIRITILILCDLRPHARHKGRAPAGVESRAVDVLKVV